MLPLCRRVGHRTVPYEPGASSAREIDLLMVPFLIGVTLTHNLEGG